MISRPPEPIQKSRALVFAFLIAAGSTDAAFGQQSVSIAEPSNDTSYSPTVKQIGVGGASLPNQTFTLYVNSKADGSGTPYSSTVVTASPAGTWPANLPAPSNGWPPNTPLYNFAMNAGVIVSNTVQIYINGS